MTDEQIDDLWIHRPSIHDGQLMPQLRDFARALLARQPATIDKQEAVCRVCNGHGYRTAMSATGEGAFNETCVYCKGTGKAAPLANEASKPAAQTLSDGAQFFACYLIDNCENEVVREESVQAWLGKMLANPRYHPAAPSVEQDERGAFEAEWKRSGWGDSDTKNQCFHFWQARAASTSANVAQGAEAVATVKVYETYTGQNGWTEVTQEEYDRTKDKYEHRIRRVPAPPVQTATTVTPAMVKAAIPWLTGLHHMRNTDAKAHIEEAIKAALTSAQSASGDTK